MPASVFDSLIFGALFDTGDVARLFSDSADLRAMLVVEGVLAKVQGARGIIPDSAAQAIHRASLDCQIDPAALAAETGTNGVPIPALLAAFRPKIPDPGAAPFVHWGATSQDIVDTALMLRLRQALALIETDAHAALRALGTLAETHAETPMAARTYGQHATPTSFGAIVAAWGHPVLECLQDLEPLRRGALWVSLSGAAGTASALGPDAAGLRADMAEALGLMDPGRSWHTDRTPILRMASWLTRLTAAWGKMGEDLALYTQSGLGDVSLGDAGASSTMPQKQNPVTPAVLSALGSQASGMSATLHHAARHRYQRDGAGWFTEWLTLPQLVLSAAAATRAARDLAPALAPDTARMTKAFERSGQMMHAEALSFALAAHMPRPEAQASVKRLCREAVETGTDLLDLVARDYPDIAQSGWTPDGRLGLAPDDARAFASLAAALPGGD